MRTVVYTALCGPKSIVQVPEWQRPDLDYICYTDQPAHLIPAPWQVRPLRKHCGDPNRNAKWYKVNPHKILGDYDVNIWVDANFKVTRGFDDLLPLLESYDIVLFKHFERDCLYDEAEVCKAMGLDDPAVIDRQIARFRAEGFPAHYGLPECGTMIRKNSSGCSVLMAEWWWRIEHGSRRDQLSFMFCVWVREMRDQVKILDRTARDGYYHVWTPHINMGPLPVQ